MAVYSIWGMANKVKIESLTCAEEVENSIFGSVYRKAGRVFFEIIREMNGTKNRENVVSEQTANVISFLGGRGRGKTSAMLSFYAYLDKLKHQQKDVWGEWSKLENKRIKFVEIPCIDAAALATNEFMIEVILAKMWDSFEAVIKENLYGSQDSHFEYLTKSVRTEFINVKKSYTILRDKETNKVREEEASVASALHELAASMNFKEEFAQLVRDYIQVLNYKCYDNRYREEEMGYLVLAIDDIDMAGIKAQSILEQTRRFLSIPQVIVLLTADIDRLKNVCETFYQSVYPKGINLQKFVGEYLEKVLPTNQRIYMPELSEGQKEISIDKNNRIIEKLNLKSDCEKEMILEFMAHKCGIYFDGIRRRRHFLQNDSLRNLVNYFNNAVNLEENEYIAWLKDDLQERILDRVEDEKHRNFLKSLAVKDYEDMNSYVLNYIRNNLKDGRDLINVSDKSMGQVLYACSLFEEENADNINFVNYILFLYTIMLRQVSDDDLRSKIIGDSIWGAWEYGMLSTSLVNTSLISGFENRAELALEITEDAEEFMNAGEIVDAMNELMEHNYKQIVGWLYAMLFVNFKQLDHFNFRVSKEQRTIRTKSGECRLNYIVVYPRVYAARGYFGFLNNCENSYQHVLRQLLTDVIAQVYDAICEEEDQMSWDEEIDELIDTNLEYVKSIKLLDKEESIDFVRSVEIIYSIGQEIGREQTVNIGENFRIFDKMQSIYQVVREELQKRDQYYASMGITTNFEHDFTRKLHTMIFLEPDEVFDDDEILNNFFEYYTRIFRSVVSVDKN